MHESEAIAGHLNIYFSRQCQMKISPEGICQLFIAMRLMVATCIYTYCVDTKSSVNIAVTGQ
jgi:hypothetical protein